MDRKHGKPLCWIIWFQMHLVKINKSVMYVKIQTNNKTLYTKNYFELDIFKLI